MPTYQYRCTECGRDLEAVQKFTDAALTECPSCNGQLRKVYNAVGVVFKGSGFYRTDSRNGKESAEGGSGNGSKVGSESTSGSKEPSSAPAEKVGSTPAPAKSGSGSSSSSNGSSSSSTAAAAAS